MLAPKHMPATKSAKDTSPTATFPGDTTDPISDEDVAVVGILDLLQQVRQRIDLQRLVTFASLNLIVQMLIVQM